MNEALRLADELDYVTYGIRDVSTTRVMDKASDELRRLAAVEAQRDALLEALRYWLPDETMIPAGHEAKWNEAVAAIAAVEGGEDMSTNTEALHIVPSRPLRELLDAAVKAEREACARVCDDLADISGHYAIAATAIRKRGEE